MTAPTPTTTESTTFTARIWIDGGTTHVDVRGLPPPQPLVQILQLVERAGDGEALVVHHDRDPVMLYVELVQRGWWAERIDGDPGEFRLRLERSAG